MAEKIFRNTYLVGDGVPCVGCVDDDGIIYDNSEPSFFHQVGCVTPEGEVYETTTKTLGGQIGLVRDGNVYDFKQGIGFGDAIAFFDGDDLKLLFSNGMPDSIRVGYTESSSVYARGAAAYFLLKGKMAKPKGGYSYAWKKLNDQQPASNDNGQSSPYTSSDSSSGGSNASGFIPVGGGCLESLAENFIIFLLGLGGLVMFLNFADKDKRPVLYWTVELSLWALLIFGVYKLITRNMTEEEKAEKLARIKSWFSGIRINAPKISIKKPDSAASWNNTVQNYGQKASSGSPYTSSGSYTSVNNSG